MSAASGKAPSSGVEVRLPPEAYARMTLVLRMGLLLALTILAVTLGVYLVKEPSATSQATIGSNPALEYLSLDGLGRGLATGSPAAYLTVGVLVLVATPAVRVLSGFYYFERGGEKAMASITISVFVLLLLGLLVIGPFVR